MLVNFSCRCCDFLWHHHWLESYSALWSVCQLCYCKFNASPLTVDIFKYSWHQYALLFENLQLDYTSNCGNFLCVAYYFVHVHGNILLFPQSYVYTFKKWVFFPFSQSTDEKVYKFRYFKIASSVLFRFSCLSILFLFNEKSFILNVSCNLKKNMLLPVLSLNNELGEGKQLIL